MEILTALLLIVIILMSLSVHEWAHAAVAYLFGDPTAKDHGRLTVNPLAHWDRVGTTALVVLLILRTIGMPVPVFGWGKPVPIDERNFENPRWYSLQTSLAGPMSNILIALVFGLISRFVSVGDFWTVLISSIVYINVFLGLFNLIPIPPLDGSQIIRQLMSERTYALLVSNPLFYYGLIIAVIMFGLGPLQIAAINMSRFFLGI